MEFDAGNVRVCIAAAQIVCPRLESVNLMKMEDRLALHGVSYAQIFNNSFVSITFYSEGEEQGGSESGEAGCDAVESALECDVGESECRSLGGVKEAGLELFFLTVTCVTVFLLVIVHLPSDACELVSNVGGGVAAAECVLVVFTARTRKSGGVHRCVAGCCA